MTDDRRISLGRDAIGSTIITGNGNIVVLQAAGLVRELKDTGIKVNSVCPGWVRTDMGGPDATRTVEEGAAGIVWAACLPDNGPGGGFFRDGKPIPW